MQLKKETYQEDHYYPIQPMKTYNQERKNGNSEETCFKVVFRWRHISSKFNQDVLIFFDGGYKLKSEESSSLTKFWAIE